MCTHAIVYITLFCKHTHMQRNHAESSTANFRPVDQPVDQSVHDYIYIHAHEYTDMHSYMHVSIVTQMISKYVHWLISLYTYLQIQTQMNVYVCLSKLRVHIHMQLLPRGCKYQNTHTYCIHMYITILYI